MKTLIKTFKILLLVVVLVLSGGLIYFKTKFPAVDKAKAIKVEITPERIERGRYLAHDLLGCIDCHSERDWTKYSGPLIEGTEGKGGMMFNESMANIPGVIYAKNITPAGIGDWTDGELLRMITTGVNKDGQAQFPLMPFMSYSKLCEEDLYSVIAFIRSLKPIENKVTARSLNFPMNLIVSTIPMNAPEKFPMMPDKSDSIAYGKYLVNAAACMDCHSKLEKGQIEPGKEFAGGFRFCIPGGNCVTSSNITPDDETGIGLLSKEAFLDKFRFYRQAEARRRVVGQGENQTVMPWSQFQALPDEDLSAMYDYLRTLQPVKNKIEKFTKL